MATLTRTISVTTTQRHTLSRQGAAPRACEEHTLPLAKESSDVPRRWLDKLVAFDHKISMHLLTMPSLGPLEYALSLPGSMFGIPLYSLVMTPCLVGAAGEALSSTADGSVAWVVGLTALVLGVAFWALCLVESVSNPPTSEHTGVVRAFYPLGKKLGTVVTLFAPHLSVWAVGLSSQEARGAAAFYVALFYVTQLLVELGKAVSWRVRPVGRYRARLQRVKRQIPQIQDFLSREHAMNLSFPSGDAAGSTTFAVVGLSLTATWSWALAPVWLFFPLLSTFARVYFQAHYATDVVAGHAIAGVTAAAFFAHFGADVTGFTWASLVLCEIPVILCWALIQKLKPKSAEAIYNADNLIGAFRGRTASAGSRRAGDVSGKPKAG